MQSKYYRKSILAYFQTYLVVSLAILVPMYIISFIIAYPFQDTEKIAAEKQAHKEATTIIQKQYKEAIDLESSKHQEIINKLTTKQALLSVKKGNAKVNISKPLSAAQKEKINQKFNKYCEILHLKR